MSVTCVLSQCSAHCSVFPGDSGLYIVIGRVWRQPVMCQQYPADRTSQSDSLPHHTFAHSSSSGEQTWCPDPPGRSPDPLSWSRLKLHKKIVIKIIYMYIFVSQPYTGIYINVTVISIKSSYLTISTMLGIMFKVTLGPIFQFNSIFVQNLASKLSASDIKFHEGNLCICCMFNTSRRYYK